MYKKFGMIAKWDKVKFFKKEKNIAISFYIVICMEIIY